MTAYTDPSEPKYDVEVELSGRDGNAFNIIASVVNAMKRAHIPEEEIRAFKREAKSGDYDHLLQTCMRYVNVR